VAFDAVQPWKTEFIVQHAIVSVKLISSKGEFDCATHIVQTGQRIDELLHVGSVAFGAWSAMQEKRSADGGTCEKWPKTGIRTGVPGAVVADWPPAPYASGDPFTRLFV
jgi:hypothetical protein